MLCAKVDPSVSRMRLFAASLMIVAAAFAPVPAFAEDVGAASAEGPVAIETAGESATDVSVASEETGVETKAGEPAQAEQASSDDGTRQAASGDEGADASDGSSADDSSQAAAKVQGVAADGAASDDGSVADAPAVAQGRWVVTSAYGQGLQRYWFVGDEMAKCRLVTPDEGAGCYAYATPAGYVVRGAYKASDGSFYLGDNDGRLTVSRWVVSSAYGQGLQRYWAGSEGAFAKGRLVTADEGAGWYAYATPSCYVVRGTYEASDGTICVADNDGRLAGPGWAVGDYGQGLQRYWVDADRRGCVPGYSTDGWAHYTTPSGYVVRGGYRAPDGSLRYADNDGRLSVSSWVVTAAFGHGLQRYWAGSEGAFAKGGLVTPDEGAGWYAYATPSCYVVRGAYAASDGTVYVANNDGRIPNVGWVVGDYGQGLQRYWVDATKRGCVPGYSDDGWAHCTTSAGYVLRGRCRLGEGMLLADNDGRLATAKGWTVSSAYGDGLQRYWLDEVCQGHVGARLGLFEADGSLRYGKPDQGYVSRTEINKVDGSWYASDNDGKLTKLNDNQARVADACLSTPSPGGNLCSEWVTEVFEKAGFGYYAGDACDQYYAYCHSADLSQLKPGMVIAVGHHGHTWAGHRWGHIAIYLGGDVFYDNVGWIRTGSASWWLDYYAQSGPYGSSEQPRWGWLGNFALA
jgi:hypothetical protein